MPGFVYKAIGPDGKEKKGNIQAASKVQGSVTGIPTGFTDLDNKAPHLSLNYNFLIDLNNKINNIDPR